jgi:hypothetical protein
MRTIFISAFLFFSLGTTAQQYLLKNENVIFSFDTQSGKHVVLAKDKDNAYIVYRYGTTDSIEFEYPEKNKDSWKKFKYAWYLRGGGVQNEGMDLNYVYFTNNGYKYYIYDVYNAVNNRTGIGIGVTNLKTNKTVTIKGAKTTRKGSMTDLRDSDLVERDTDLIEVDDIKP